MIFSISREIDFLRICIKNFGICFLFLGLGSFQVQGKLVTPYEVDRISFAYGGKSEDLPSLEPLRDAFLNLSFTDGSVLLGSLMEPGDKPMMVSYRDLHLLGEVPVQYLKSRGYEGLVAFPDPNQIDPVSGKDLRVGDDTSLRILVWVSRLKRVKL